jgi:hypothetical protein
MAVYGPSIADIEALTKKRQESLAALPADERRSREFDISQGYVNTPEQDLAKLAADIIESYDKLTTDALAELGVFTFDDAAAREQAIALISPYFEQQLTYIKNDINEGRLQTVEDYNARISDITDGATATLKTIAISESKNEEELVNKLSAIGGREAYEKAEQVKTISEAAEELQMNLDNIRGGRDYSVEKEQATIAEAQEKLDTTLSDIGGRKDYNFATAKASWEDKIRQEEESQLGRGRGFSGVMKSVMERMDTGQSLDLGEIIRKAGVEETTALREEKYTTAGAQRDIRELLRQSNMAEQEATFAERVTREQAERNMAESERQATQQRTEAQTSFTYTAEAAKAAREEALATQQRELGYATTLGQRGIRQYGTDTSTPQELIPEGTLPEYGIYGSQKVGELGREKEEATLSQINELRAQAQAEHELARSDTLAGLPTLDTYFSKEYLTRKSKL